jgi:hypothetical protein
MSLKPADTLSHFFSIPKATIQRDLLRAEGNFEVIHSELQELQSIDRAERSPETEAKIYHLYMVQAYELCRLSHVGNELKTFYASVGAGQVVEDAEMDAYGKGMLSELSNEMEQIRLREGLTSDQFWYKGEGPDDYEFLGERYEEVIEKISDTVFTHTLNRYDLVDVAELYESNRTEFEIQKEIGRRVVFVDKDVDEEIIKRMDEMIREKLGSDAFERILKRVKELTRKKN